MSPVRGKKFLVLLVLCAVAGLVLAFEVAGGETRLRVRLSGDLGRETRWIGQYGQLACVTIVGLLIWSLDVPRRRTVLPLMVATILATAGVAAAVKRLAGRVRPGFDNAGQFLGPRAASGAKHQSFPSGHTASAVALTLVLARTYPAAGRLFWSLAIGCAALRWVRQAHWLSDVLAGAALGYAVSHLVIALFERPPPIWRRARAASSDLAGAAA